MKTLICSKCGREVDGLPENAVSVNHYECEKSQRVRIQVRADKSEEYEFEEATLP